MTTLIAIGILFFFAVLFSYAYFYKPVIRSYKDDHNRQRYLHP